MADREDIGKALGKLASGVFVASCGTADQSITFIASWVQQAAFEPPSLTIAVQFERPALDALARCEGRFTLSILPEKRHDLMKPFFGEPDPEKPFGDLETAVDPFGGRYITEGLGWLACKETNRMQVGDHYVIGAEVVDGALLSEDGGPMVHVRKTGFSY
jgi:flavin reductase (DIM6/NTAB) family NADH-FMN oxidoreductase RutF